MARVRRNSLISGLSGRMGQLVFRVIGKNTFVSPAPRKPDKCNETDAQRETRDRFRKASQWASLELLDPEKKKLYQQKAKKWGLPNAYTAAIKEYFRRQEEEALCEECRWDFSEYDVTSPDSGSSAHSENSDKYDSGFWDSGSYALSEDSCTYDSGFSDTEFSDSGRGADSESSAKPSSSGLAVSESSTKPVPIAIGTGCCPRSACEALMLDADAGCRMMQHDENELPAQSKTLQETMLDVGYLISDSSTDVVGVDQQPVSRIDIRTTLSFESSADRHGEAMNENNDLRSRHSRTAVVGVLHQQPVSRIAIEKAPLSFRLASRSVHEGWRGAGPRPPKRLAKVGVRYTRDEGVG